MALASLNSLCHTTLSHSSRPNHYTLPHCHHQAPISLPLSLSLTVDLSNLLNSHNLLTSSLYLWSLTHPLLSLFWLLCSVCYFCFWVCIYTYICVRVCVCVGIGRGRKSWFLRNTAAQNRSNRTLYTAPHCIYNHKTEVHCGYTFGQIAPQNTVLKITQKSTKPRCKHPYEDLSTSMLHQVFG